MVTNISHQKIIRHWPLCGHFLHFVIQSGVNHVGCAQDIGLDCLKGVELGRWDLLKRRSMDDDVDTFHDLEDPIAVPHVADKHTQV